MRRLRLNPFYAPAFFAGLFALVCSQGVLAEPEASRSAAGSSAEQQVLVSNAQRLTIRFNEIPRLNGDYRINFDETVTIPGLGRVPVAGLTAQKFEQLLAETATAAAGRDVSDTAEVAEFRPIFITGHVSRPGPWPWQPGITVGDAVAAAGGIARSNDDASVRERKARADQARVIAALARARAEQQGTAKVEIPAQLTALTGAAQAKKLIDAQTVLMENRRGALKKQQDAIAVGKSLTNQELESLRVQRSRLEDQLKMRRKQSERIQLLLEQKLTVSDRALEESIKVSDLEEKYANLSVGIARVQATMANFDRDALNASEARKAEFDLEAIRLERELAQLSAELNIKPDQVEEPGAPVAAESKTGVRFIITRRVNGMSNASAAEDSSVLAAGDVLAVQP